MKRLFIAIPLSEEAKEKIKQVKSDLQESGADLRSVASENLHFTVKFLGNIQESKIDEIAKKIDDLQLSSFSIQARGVGVFPSVEHIQTIWVGAENGTLTLLLKKVNSLFDYQHARKEDTPHATLARVKSEKNKEKLKEVVKRFSQTNFGEIKVEKIILYESELTPQGPVYKIIKEIFLKKEPN
ncbi:RNA 2',3'-cyclic phosphodiesterase [Candidatus Woesearchaeota archaeon]|nr:RNA 2',3'-cyclic phosphodiesterase [Candidatus Woesearchaeota archaeon]